jgi:biotin operon repressor
MARNAFLIVAKELAADKRISVTARLLLAQLLDHRNRKTAQCNPRETRLAEELGVSRRTIIRRLEELKKVGLLAVKRTGRSLQFEILMCQLVTSDVPNGHIAMCQSVTSEPPHPLYESYQGEVSGSALKRAAAATPPFEQSPNAPPGPPGIPRKEMGWEEFLTHIPRGRLLNRTEMNQVTMAVILENHRRKYGA